MSRSASTTPVTAGPVRPGPWARTALRAGGADPRVGAVRGRAAIERGPLVYCLEGVDNPGGGLDDIVIDAGRPLREEHHPELLGGVGTVTAAGHRRTMPDNGWLSRRTSR